jgi:hypothetical protein
MSNVRPNAVCIAQLRSILQAFSRLVFDDRASSRVHNPKVGRVTKSCDLREMKRASHYDLRAKNPKVANVYLGRGTRQSKNLECRR